MKITQAREDVTDVTVALKDVKPGEVLRFAHDSLEDAFKAELFYMKLETPELKGNRVRLVAISSGKVTEYDDIHRVITHVAELQLFNLKLQ